MALSFSKRIDIFSALGLKIKKVLEVPSRQNLSDAEKALQDEITHAAFHNPWFTAENVRFALEGIASMLDANRLAAWISRYKIKDTADDHLLDVAVIMAGNIPFVAFHDLLCVLLSGNRFKGKMSSQDKILPVKIAALIEEINPEMASRISLHEDMIKGFDAVIATGSNNSARYFHYYFGKYPHIIRSNRNSMAVITGNETSEELKGIGSDIYRFFGLGCRNVSKILIPQGYAISRLLDCLADWEQLKDHHKYFNNYEYRKTVMLINSIPHLDTGFSLFTQNQSLVSPISVIHYSHYDTEDTVFKFIDQHKEMLQCVVSARPLPGGIKEVVAPGATQLPGPEEYADNIDTIEFLASL